MAENKRASKAKKVYVLKDGETARSSASTGHQAKAVERLEFRFADGTVRPVALGDIKDKDVLLAATWHGLSQKLGDSYSSKSGDEAIAAFDAAFENLVNGMWVEKGEGAETVPSLLVDAVLAALEKAGTPGDRGKIEAKLSPRDAEGSLDKPAAKAAREGALANGAIKAEYERIKAERAAARAAKAAEAAKTADTTNLADFA